MDDPGRRIHRSATRSQMIQDIKNLPPEEALEQSLQRLAELSDTRFYEASAANARLLTLHKLAKQSMLLLRSLSETSEHPLSATTIKTTIKKTQDR